MNTHLQWIRELHAINAIPQPEQGVREALSDMDVIMRQAFLMTGGSEVFRALQSGSMEKILLGLTDLAYAALEGLALQGADVQEQPVAWQHDGYVLSLMRIVSDKINLCSSGRAEHYSGVYCLCRHLTSSFLNADFDKALQVLHTSKLEKHDNAPDLSDCLYE